MMHRQLSRSVYNNAVLATAAPRRTHLFHALRAGNRFAYRRASARAHSDFLPPFSFSTPRHKHICA